MNTNQDTHKLKLEADLEADITGVFKESLMNDFSQQADKIKKYLHQGVHPEDYKKMTLVLEAIEMASDTIDWVWQNYHYNK